jgi:acyl-CoA reductase-like NAD-dependent aldehyde dehydrogenase
MTVNGTPKLDFTVFSNVINGKLVGTKSTRCGIDPTTGEALFPVPVSTPEDVDTAIKAARAAFQSWKQTEIEHRKQQLLAFAAALLSYKSEFGELLNREQGKAVKHDWSFILIKQVANDVTDDSGTGRS